VKVSISKPALQAAQSSSEKEGTQSVRAGPPKTDVGTNGTAKPRGSENGTVKVTGTQGVFTDGGSWPPVAAEEQTEKEAVSENVASARSWIGAWREKAGKKQLVMQ
jgi:hypothetical protein